MVAVTRLPPAMALRLQETVVSAAPVTVPVKVCVLPKRSEALVGVTVTATEEEGGAGGGTTTELAFAPPVLPAQPSVQAAVERRMRSGNAAKRGPAAL